MRTGYLIAVLVLAGCATAKPIIAPDGKTAYRLDCSGTSRSWGDCMQKAGETCGAHGYDVLARNEEHPQTSLIAEKDVGDVIGKNTVARELIVRCKEPAGAATPS